MDTVTALVSAAVIGLLFRQVMHFQESLKELAGRMAALEGAGVPAIHYQNSMTPPWLPALWIALALALVAILIAAAVSGGMLAVVYPAAGLVAGMLASAAMRGLLSWPTTLTCYRVAFHTLANRQANYRRTGDIERARAAEHFQSLMLSLVGSNVLTK